MVRGKYLSLEEARKLKRLDPFARERGPEDGNPDPDDQSVVGSLRIAPQDQASATTQPRPGRGGRG